MVQRRMKLKFEIDQEPFQM